MRVCGIKLTHDAGVAVIEDGRVLFSIEMEKLGNAPRYSNIRDLSQVFGVLAMEGLDAGDIDIYVTVQGGA